MEFKQNAIKTTLLGVGTIAGTIATPAYSSTVTFTDEIDVPLFAIEGDTPTSFSGIFDIASLVESTGEDLSDYSLVSANVKALGYSDKETVESNTTSDYSVYSSQSRQTSAGYYVSGYYYSGSCGWGCYYSGGYSGYYVSPRYATDYYYERTSTDRFVDEIREAMRLNVGTDSFSAQADTHEFSSTTLPEQNFTSGSHSNGYGFYKTYRSQEVDAWYGQLSIDQSLSNESKTALMTTGMLGFAVLSELGSFSLNELQLTVSLEKIEITEVPEPSSILLFVTALGIIRQFRSNGQPVFA
jgi:hypothetical protein